MGKNRNLKKYRKVAQKTIDQVFNRTIRPEPSFFIARWIYRIAFRIVMISKQKND